LYNNKNKIILKGEKPAEFPAIKPITKRERERSLKPNIANPINISTQFLQHLNENPGSTYGDVAKVFGACKTRVCQMLALCNRLPEQITNYLLNSDEPEILKLFNERRLRPLMLMASVDEKINRFNKMRENINSRMT